MNAHPKFSVETATQLAVFLANRPGALARVCEALANAGINIMRWLHRILSTTASPKSMSAFVGSLGREAERGLIILRTSNVEKARRILQEL